MRRLHLFVALLCLFSPTIRAGTFAPQDQCLAFVTVDGWKPEGGGITLYPMVVFASQATEVDEQIRQHENVHCRQVKRDGVASFYFNYLRYYAKNRYNGMGHTMAYAAIPYEIEAYAEAGQGEYLRRMIIGEDK